MTISRREFTLGATSLVALTVLGCTDESSSAGNVNNLAKRKSDKSDIPKKIFSVGNPDKYRKPGVYDEYNKTHRTWLVSNGSKLVALVDVCTHLGCELAWLSEINLFECPCHTSQFDAQGTNQIGGKAKRPMERFAISLVDAPLGGSLPTGKVVQIDPTVRLRKDHNQWEDPRASIDLPKDSVPAS